LIRNVFGYLRYFSDTAKRGYDLPICADRAWDALREFTERGVREVKKVTNSSWRSLASSRWITLSLRAFLLIALLSAIGAGPASAQANRKVKFSVQPDYPELARKNNIHGTARVELLIAADGNVKDVKVLGGNPVLAQAAVDAAKKWKYEAASAETTAVLKFDFTP
jgi:TonB family protein